MAENLEHEAASEIHIYFPLLLFLSSLSLSLSLSLKVFEQFARHQVKVDLISTTEANISLTIHEVGVKGRGGNTGE